MPVYRPTCEYVHACVPIPRVHRCALVPGSHHGDVGQPHGRRGAGVADHLLALADRHGGDEAGGPRGRLHVGEPLAPRRCRHQPEEGEADGDTEILPGWGHWAQHQPQHRAVQDLSPRLGM